MAEKSITIAGYKLFPNPRNQHAEIFANQVFVPYPYTLIDLPSFYFKGRASLYAACRLAEGCSWNHCTFCEMYTAPQKTFRARDESEVLDSIRHTGDQYAGEIRRIFLANAGADLRLQLLREPRRDRAGGQPARLGMADEAARTEPEIETNFRQLRRLARAGFAADDDDLILQDQLGNVRPPFIDRQIALELRLWQPGPAFGHGRAGTLEQCSEIGLQFFALFSG